MADIRGFYEFHRDCPSQQLIITEVDQHGSLSSASIDNTAINGTYTSSTNAISFNDAPGPGDLFYVSFYSGFAIPNEAGGVCALAGTYHELLIRFSPFSLETKQSGWYAIWRGPIIE